MLGPKHHHALRPTELILDDDRIGSTGIDLAIHQTDKPHCAERSIEITVRGSIPAPFSDLRAISTRE